MIKEILRDAVNNFEKEMSSHRETKVKIPTPWIMKYLSLTIVSLILIFVLNGLAGSRFVWLANIGRFIQVIAVMLLFFVSIVMSRRVTKLRKKSE